MTRSRYFHRFDDIGKYRVEIESLFKMLDGEDIPMILAVIPAELDRKMADVILGLENAIIFQHGYVHINHVKDGWFDEFPDILKQHQIEGLIQKGRSILEDKLMCEVNGYVPPWNNTSQKTIKVLEELGYQCFSSQVNNSPETGMSKVDILIDSNSQYTPHHILKSNFEIKSECEDNNQCKITGIMYHPEQYDNDDVDHIFELINSLKERNLTLKELRKIMEGQ